MLSVINKVNTTEVLASCTHDSLERPILASRLTPQHHCARSLILQLTEFFVAILAKWELIDRLLGVHEMTATAVNVKDAMISS